MTYDLNSKLLNAVNVFLVIIKHIGENCELTEWYVIKIGVKQGLMLT